MLSLIYFFGEIKTWIAFSCFLGPFPLTTDRRTIIPQVQPWLFAGPERVPWLHVVEIYKPFRTSSSPASFFGHHLMLSHNISIFGKQRYSPPNKFLNDCFHLIIWPATDFCTTCYQFPTRMPLTFIISGIGIHCKLDQAMGCLSACLGKEIAWPTIKLNL